MAYQLKRPIPGIPRWVGHMTISGGREPSGRHCINVRAKVGKRRLRLWVLWRVLRGRAGAD